MLQGNVVRLLWILLASLTGSAAPSLGDEATEGHVAVELNKLEINGIGCQPYLVFENKTELDFNSLKLDLVMFDIEGIIARRIAVEGAPLPPGKMSVKVFDLTDLACDQIGRVLLNGLTQCADRNGERSDCLTLMETASRAADVTFIQ